MKFDTDYIDQLAKIIADNELTEISLEDGNQAITIRKDLPEVVSTGVAMPVAAPAQPAPAQAPAAAVAPKAESAEPAKKGNPVVSPMVGTFYSKPAPDKEAFVKVGDTVSSGDVVCIIEAMKLMNEIETEFSGKVVEICVEDGQAVEYGQTIMYIE